MADERITCAKCGRLKRETEFFKKKSGGRDDMCKDCLTMHIDNRNPDTFLWILEKFDVPYIEKQWVGMVNKKYMENPSKFGPKSVIGTYIRTMNMQQYRDYGYADSDRLNFEDQKNEQAMMAKRAEMGDSAAREAELKAKLEAGEITQAEYDTLSFQTQSSAEMAVPNMGPQFIPDASVDEEKIRSELSEEDIKYLITKWGGFYTPSQWVKMEELYQNYANEYELNVDREGVLIKICKISLKMDEALDIGDIKTFKDLSGTFDQLRKSGSFTEAQKKEEQQRTIDSIGELVAFVEQEGGAIPQYDDPIEYPKDKVDFTIKNMQNYVSRLVKEELGLTDIIESFIQRAEKQKVESVEEILESSFADEAEQLTVEDVRDFQEFLESEIEDEAHRLAKEFGEANES